MSIFAQPDTPARTLPSAAAVSAASGTAPGSSIRSRLFTKYVALFVAVVGVALLCNGIFEVYFYYREHKAALVRIQREQAVAAAAKISQFIKEIENQLGWTTQLPWSATSIEQRRFDALRLLPLVPAITELAQVDATGKERLRVSRLARDVVDSGIDLSADPKFTEAVARKVYYGPVYFRRESEPYMTLALAGARKDAGVSIAEVNLKLIWDVVSQIKVGEHGRAYVVDAQGRLIAHPDISLVLRNTDMSGLEQVQAARTGGDAASEALQGSLNIQGQKVLTASAPIVPLRWTMFVELPVEEAYASLYASLQRLAIVLLAASAFAVLAGVFLARRMVGPIQALRSGAERIGGGDFSQRISIKTGDELEGLANQFNEMGARLQESYADLEKKVERRTAELSEALQQQTATADVLKVISRSAFDLNAVLDTLVSSAANLCGADGGIIFQRDGDVYRFGANYGLSSEFVEYAREHPIQIDRSTLTGRVALEGKTVQITDVLSDTDYTTGYRQHAAYRTLLGVPLLRGGVPIGSFSLTRSVVQPFTPRQVELVETFADQAVIAIENARLFEEVQARTTELQESLKQQTAVGDVLKIISRSKFDLQPVLDTLVETAARLCDADMAFILRREGEVYRAGAAVGFSAEYIRFLRDHPIAVDRGTVTGRVALERHTVQILDVANDPEYTLTESTTLAGQRTALGVPLLRENESIGAIVLARRRVEAFSPKQIELVTTFADQAVIAIENVRLFEELRESLRLQTETLEDLRTAQDRLIQTEKLASLGQLTAGIAHEIKNPLNFVNNFSSVSVELIDELNDVLKSAALDDKTGEEVDELTHMLKGNLEKVVQHGKRADSIVKNMLLHSREGSGERRAADINAIVEESLNLAYHGARAEKSGFNITLKRDFDPDAAMVDLYPQEITRVLLNLISNGFYAATKRKEVAGDGFEPILSASTRSLGNKVEIRIRDNGTGIPPAVKEKMFNPFFTTKPAGEGTGLGLSMSHDIVVKQHGGKIDVDTEPGAFTEFIIILPRTWAVQGNTGGRK